MRIHQIQFRPPRDPFDQAGCGYPDGVFDRPRAADDADVALGFQPRPIETVFGRKPVDRQCRVEGAFDRSTRDLAVALRIMPVADIDMPAIDIGPDVERGAGAEIRNVEIAAEVTRDDAEADFAMRRRDPQGAMKWPERTCSRAPERVGVTSEVRSASKVQIQTRSSCGCWRFGLARVPESRPKSGEIVATPQSRAGSSAIRRMARTSPATTPSTAIGPVSGLTFGYGATSRGRPSTSVSLPEKQSSVKTVKTSPGRTVLRGAWPPK